MMLIHSITRSARSSSACGNGAVDREALQHQALEPATDPPVNCTLGPLRVCARQLRPAPLGRPMMASRRTGYRTSRCRSGATGAQTVSGSLSCDAGAWANPVARAARGAACQRQQRFHGGWGGAPRWCRVRGYAVLKRPADLPSWQGANHSNTRRYCEDLQRRHGGKGAAHKCCIASNTTLDHHRAGFMRHPARQ